MLAIGARAARSVFREIEPPVAAAAADECVDDACTLETEVDVDVLAAALLPVGAAVLDGSLDDDETLRGGHVFFWRSRARWWRRWWWTASGAWAVTEDASARTSNAARDLQTNMIVGESQRKGQLLSVKNVESTTRRETEKISKPTQSTERRGGVQDGLQN